MEDKDKPAGADVPPDAAGRSGCAPIFLHIGDMLLRRAKAIGRTTQAKVRRLLTDQDVGALRPGEEDPPTRQPGG
jgi:hypothetical protein